MPSSPKPLPWRTHIAAALAALSILLFSTTSHAFAQPRLSAEPQAAKAHAAPAAPSAPTFKTGLIAQGLPSETPYFIRDSGRDGPTVLIIGGMHGNEPAGAVAAEQISHWPILRGTLVVIPRANPPALAENIRRIPGKPQRDGDLNRNFPATQSDRGVLGPTAEHLWAFITDIRPDWLLDLHEGFDFHARNPRSVGSTVIHFNDEELNRLAALMLQTVNAEVTEEEKKFQSVSRGPRETGLLRAASHHLGSRGYVLETTWADQPMSLRVRQHRLMVHTLLSELEMVDVGARSVMLPVNTSPHTSGEESDVPSIRAAIYEGPGAGESGINALMRIISSMPSATAITLAPADIRDGALQQFDIAIFTGGRGGLQGESVGAEGREKIRAFVESGGGYLGICAGAYLATARLDTYLKMVNTYHHRPWQLGRGPVEIQLTDLGAEILGTEDRTFEVRYANGPIFTYERGQQPALDLPEFQVLAHFTRGVAHGEGTRTVMEGTPAIITAPFGQGRVMLISPHPESQHELAWFIERCIDWTANAPRTHAASPRRRKTAHRMNIGRRLKRSPSTRSAANRA